MEKPAAERKYQMEEEEQDRNSREGPESSSSEPLDAKKLRRMAQNGESSRTLRLRKKGYVQQLETSRIVEPAAEEEQNRRLRIPCENSKRKKKSSSSQEKFSAAGTIPREVMSFSSPYPFFWTSMKPSNVGLRFRMVT
ncbi:transcription factor TGA9-like isoform X2 [Papaver somniferum]|uniref:transcription factor TGA9-like isoform X2 n=1 Tax=Papaver somniferum TaxID=3469 RepID=UPI000E701E4A|nr:transcription factor TGA9-like isoform X2 [Papaver somniferum]